MVIISRRNYLFRILIMVKVMMLISISDSSGQNDYKKLEIRYGVSYILPNGSLLNSNFIYASKKGLEHKVSFGYNIDSWIGLDIGVSTAKLEVDRNTLLNYYQSIVLDPSVQYPSDKPAWQLNTYEFGLHLKFDFENIKGLSAKTTVLVSSVNYKLPSFNAVFTDPKEHIITTIDNRNDSSISSQLALGYQIVPWLSVFLDGGFTFPTTFDADITIGNQHAIYNRSTLKFNYYLVKFGAGVEIHFF